MAKQEENNQGLDGLRKKRESLLNEDSMNDALDKISQWQEREEDWESGSLEETLEAIEDMAVEWKKTWDLEAVVEEFKAGDVGEKNWNTAMIRLAAFELLNIYNEIVEDLAGQDGWLVYAARKTFHTQLKELREALRKEDHYKLKLILATHDLQFPPGKEFSRFDFFSESSH